MIYNRRPGDPLVQRKSMNRFTITNNVAREPAFNFTCRIAFLRSSVSRNSPIKLAAIGIAQNIISVDSSGFQYSPSKVRIDQIRVPSDTQMNDIVAPPLRPRRTITLNIFKKGCSEL